MNKSKRNILIVSPHYLPMNDGLAHYTDFFSIELKNYANVGILTNRMNEKRTNVFPLVSSWRFFHLKALFKSQELQAFDELLIQYVPFMYNRKGGINFSFCFFIIYLRLFSPKKIQLIVHEVNYPFELNIKSMVMFFSHCSMMLMLLKASHKVFATTQYFLHQLQTFFFANNITILPVGSNIPLIKENAYSSALLTIGLFGKMHPAKEVPFTIHCLLEAWREQKNFQVVYIGESEKKIYSFFTPQEIQELRSFLKIIPESSSEEVSNQLACMHIFVAYFVDGLSARRGSVMAALEHGLEIISTRGRFTDDVFLDSSFIHLLNINKEKFKKELINTISNYKALDQKQDIRTFFLHQFSWKKIVKDYYDATTTTLSSFNEVE